MNKHPITLFILTITTAFLLSGCWDVTEPQRMYYVQGVGVDYKDNQYEAYLQLINFASVAKTEQANPQAPHNEIGKAKGKTIEEAIYKLYRSIDLEVFWGHMTYLILSEAVLQNELAIAPIDTFLRFRETRYDIWVYCTKDSIEDIMLISPILDKSPTASKLSNPENTSKQESFVEPINLRKLVIGLNEPSHEVSIPYVTINKKWERADEQTEETSFSGVGVLSKDDFKGFIKGDAARGIKWMSNETKRGEITVKLGNDERDYLTVDIEKLKVEVEPIVKNNQVNFEVDLRFNAILNGFKGEVSSDEIRKIVKEDIKKEIITTYEEGLKMDIDIFRLSEYLYRDNVKAWKKLESNGKIPLTKDSISKINVNVNKINPGRKTFEETIKK